MSSQREANRALLAVSSAVFMGSSTWLSGTAVAPSIAKAWQLDAAQEAWLTSSVQLGFIVGTFLYAFLNLPDRFSARRVFFCSTTIGAASNAGFALLADGFIEASIYRFGTGVTLAGVYPVGMKIVASWYRTGLGRSLGVMVGALVLGSALPYLLVAWGTEFPWRSPAAVSSAVAFTGGLVVLFAVGDGPYLRERAAFDGRMMFKVFRHRDFRNNACGYFGHMWELYAFWAVVGLYLAEAAPDLGDRVTSLVVFLVVASGAVGCVVGGWVSVRAGERDVAFVSLVISATACLFSGFVFDLPPFAVITVLILWGFFVVSDSPQFSALAAYTCPREYTGTALIVQNGIGFGLTIVSIQLIPWVAGAVGWQWALIFLAPGPILGARALSRLPSRPR